MGSTLDKLHTKGLIPDVPPFLINAVCYEVVMGSVAYGVSNNYSDVDVYGFSVPPKNILLPFEHEYVYGFDTNYPKFEQYSQHHIEDKSTQKEYDLTIYNICKYFRLVADNNPNMVDSLFVPQNCVLHSNNVGSLVRENRHIFLHKGCWHKFKGYAYSQLKKLKVKNPEGKRKEMVDKYGFDVKFAYHVVRLMLEVEQMLAEQDLDLQRNKEQLRAIREGRWSLKQIEDFFEVKEKGLESLYRDSKLPHSPDETEIRNLLIKCINTYFCDTVLTPSEDSYKKVVDKIKIYLSEVGL